jgi:hypothetical protein
VTTGRGLARPAALACAAALAGCGFGPGGSSEGTATLTVTRDYGSRTIVEATENDPSESETVIRILDRKAEIETRYGGGFVQSIDGLSGAEHEGRRFDWFFYVNGVESPVGAAEVRVRGGDRIWWDYRDWANAMRVPAVVGSWPEPFAQASSEPGGRLPVSVGCGGARSACATVAERLTEAGADLRAPASGSDRAGEERSLRVLVGPWRAIRGDPEASLRGPAASGVFATFERAGRGRYELVLAGTRAEPRCAYRGGAGLVAAVEATRGRRATWLVTGTDGPGVRRAAGALDAVDLGHRYAVAVSPAGRSIGVPVTGGGGGCPAGRAR